MNMTMATKTTPTDIRYVIIDMTNIFVYFFAKTITFTIHSSIIIIIVLADEVVCTVNIR
jgi:hypothetical protein